MERLYAEGAVRAIGVSNFSPDRLVDLCMNQEIKPMVNQMEIHPFYQQAEALKVMRAYGVTPPGLGPRKNMGKPLPKLSCAGIISGGFPPFPKPSAQTG